MPGGGKLNTLNQSILSERKSKGESLQIADDSLAKQKKTEHDLGLESSSWLSQTKNNHFWQSGWLVLKHLSKDVFTCFIAEPARRSPKSSCSFTCLSVRAGCSPRSFHGLDDIGQLFHSLVSPGSGSAAVWLSQCSCHGCRAWLVLGSHKPLLSSGLHRACIGSIQEAAFQIGSLFKLNTLWTQRLWLTILAGFNWGTVDDLTHLQQPVSL